VAAPTSVTSSTVTPPAPTQSGIVAGCTEYYVVQSGDSCAAIETEFSITFAQFLAWNPAGKSPPSFAFRSPLHVTNP